MSRPGAWPSHGSGSGSPIKCWGRSLGRDDSLRSGDFPSTAPTLYKTPAGKMERSPEAAGQPGGASMTERPPFRADHVGSFLRPRSLAEAREQHDGGRLDEDRKSVVEGKSVAVRGARGGRRIIQTKINTSAQAHDPLSH